MRLGGKRGQARLSLTGRMRRFSVILSTVVNCSGLQVSTAISAFFPYIFFTESLILSQVPATQN